MQKIDEILNGFIDELDYPPAAQMFSKISSGKKLRSKLILQIAGENSVATKLCAVVELIHLASLLHDDVIDEADTRRGQPSIHAIYGAKNAIMLGDILYSKGFSELVSFGDKIAKIISDAVAKLSIGEMMDVDMSEFFNTDRAKYEKMIYLKTAVLIEAAAKSAALLNPLTAQSAELFGLYGKNLGLAFQIVDDILDIAADSKTLGKPAMSDFKEGKATLPYIMLFEELQNSGDEASANRLKLLFKADLDGKDLAWLKSQFEKFNIIEKTHKIAINYGESALSALPNTDSVATDKLREIVSNMIDREF